FWRHYEAGCLGTTEDESHFFILLEMIFLHSVFARRVVPWLIKGQFTLFSVHEPVCSYTNKDR
ncbi:hypothetical protein L9F63_015235, partial [Diploptera punctata]